MNAIIVVAIIAVCTSGGLALLLRRLNKHSKRQQTSPDWTTEVDTSFVSKISKPTADKQQLPMEKPTPQDPD